MIKNLSLPEDLRLERLSPADAKAVWSLQNAVVRYLADLDSYVPITQEELAGVLSGRGLAVGIWHGEQLVGFYSACYPLPYSWMLEKAGLGMDEQSTSAYILAIFVHPEWRRRGLQHLMGCALREELQKIWSIRYLMVVVHPANLPSIREQFAQQMVAISLQEMFGGKQRLLFFRDLQQLEKITLQEKSIPLAETTAVQVALASGQVGIGLSEVDQGWGLQLAVRSTCKQ